MSPWFSRLSFSFINPVSFYNSLKEDNVVPPDMILIASIWTFSKILIKYKLWGSHTTSPYSNSGLIKDKYNFSSDNLSSLNFNIRRIFNLEYLLSMYSVWIYHIKLVDCIIITALIQWRIGATMLKIQVSNGYILGFHEPAYSRHILCACPIISPSYVQTFFSSINRHSINSFNSRTVSVHDNIFPSIMMCLHFMNRKSLNINGQ